VIIPSGDTVLRVGDIVTVFSRTAARRLFAERLKVGSVKNQESRTKN
jgi:Trk K+ transport system NAD-binding subunit